MGDWRIIAVYPLLLFIDFLLSIPAVSGKLFNDFRCPGMHLYTCCMPRVTCVHVGLPPWPPCKLQAPVCRRTYGM